MKVKFSNGVTKECGAPIEQKVFKTIGGETIGTGWVLILKLSGNITSTELDSLLTSENVETLEFLSETESGEEKSLFSLTGYCKITSSMIRHAEETTTTSAELQLSKGM